MEESESEHSRQSGRFPEPYAPLGQSECDLDHNLTKLCPLTYTVVMARSLSPPKQA
jgi:hypothetical protein